MTKHIKKNHPQYAHTPDAVSLASFGPDTPQLGYTPSIGASSAPQTPSDGENSDDDTANGSYSYFPPQLGISQHELPPYSIGGGASSKSSHTRYDDRHYDDFGGAYSEGYRPEAPAMDRTVSHSSQAYITPPTTHETRFRSSRRKAAATQGRYREYNSDEDEYDDGDDYHPGADGRGGDDDDDYVEGAEPDISSAHKYRRGAVSVGSSRISRQLRYPGNQRRGDHSAASARDAYASQQQSRYDSQRQQAYENQDYYDSQQFAPPLPPQRPASYQTYHQHQSHDHSKQEYSPHLSHQASLSSYAMGQSYNTAPIPQYEFDPHTSHHDDHSSLGFAAPPPLRRASSFSILENNAHHFSSAAGPMQNFAQHHLGHGASSYTDVGDSPATHGGTGGVGLGLSLGSPFTPELHERRLSELHNPTANAGGASGAGAAFDAYDVYQDEVDLDAPGFAPPAPGPLSSASDPLPLPSSPQADDPSSFKASSLTFARPLSTGNTPRRGSIGFPSLPHHLTQSSSQPASFTDSNTNDGHELGHRGGGGGARLSHRTSLSSQQPQEAGPWATTSFGRPAPTAHFSNMTSRLLERMEEDETAQRQHAAAIYQDHLAC